MTDCDCITSREKQREIYTGEAVTDILEEEGERRRGQIKICRPDS